MGWPQSAESCSGNDSLEMQLMTEILDCDCAPARRHVAAEVQRSEKQLILEICGVQLARYSQNAKSDRKSKRIRGPESAREAPAITGSWHQVDRDAVPGHGIPLCLKGASDDTSQLHGGIILNTRNGYTGQSGLHFNCDIDRHRRGGLYNSPMDNRTLGHILLHSSMVLR